MDIGSEEEEEEGEHLSDITIPTYSSNTKGRRGGGKRGGRKRGYGKRKNYRSRGGGAAKKARTGSYRFVDF